LTRANLIPPEITRSGYFHTNRDGTLDRLAPDKPSINASPRGLAFYAVKIARLGGYLNRRSDPPPGNMVMWRGLTRLTDIALGISLAAKLVGN
jgi:hypothetical protein